MVTIDTQAALEEVKNLIDFDDSSLIQGSYTNNNYRKVFKPALKPAQHIGSMLEAFP